MADPKKVIKIEAISDKPDKVKFSIKSGDIWYGQFKQWEGVNKTVYNQLLFGNHNQPFKVGDMAIISYKLGEYNGEIQYNLTSIFPSDGTQLPPQAEQPLKVANNASQSESDFWDKKAYKQCLWGFWLQANNGILTNDWKQLVWDAFYDIEQDADKRFATGMEKARAIFKKDEEPLPEELPIIQSMECEVCGMDGRIKDDGHPCIPF